MSDKKSTGSYYTPKILSDFLVDHVFSRYINNINISVLEPSCGDGQFISSISENQNIIQGFREIKLDLVDINEEELNKTYKSVKEVNVIKAKKSNSNYLKTFLNQKRKKKYSLIIGNPPYIRKRNMDKDQIETCEKVRKVASDYSSLITTKKRINNIWTSFVEAAIMSLKEDGILCFVIPAEIMQVDYPKELRELIQVEFDRVEVFAFNELIFEGIQQDVVALIGIKTLPNIKEHGFSFYQVDNLEDLTEPKYSELHKNIHKLKLDKWTSYLLSDQELEFVKILKTKYKPIINYCKKIEVGIVSAANDFFILDNSQVRKHNLNRLNIVKPILLKGGLVSGLINYRLDDHKQLNNKGERVNLIHFPNKKKQSLSKTAQKYILVGEQTKGSDEKFLHERYKMTKRENWYHVPSVWKSEGFFVKRCDEFPKLIHNASDSFATDSFYRIVTNSDSDMKKLTFSFYNTLTFIEAELGGRFYGGGVLELTPNEFKKIIIPYKSNLTSDHFLKLDTMFRDDVNIETILDYTDSILLPDVSKDEIKKLRQIRRKLIDRRKKKKNEISVTGNNNSTKKRELIS